LSHETSKVPPSQREKIVLDWICCQGFIRKLQKEILAHDKFLRGLMVAMDHPLFTVSPHVAGGKVVFVAHA
jgi:hypothetical protein